MGGWWVGGVGSELGRPGRLGSLAVGGRISEVPMVRGPAKGSNVCPLCLLRPLCLQAKSQGDAELLDRLEGKARVLGLQARLADALEAAGAAMPAPMGLHRAAALRRSAVHWS